MTTGVHVARAWRERHATMLGWAAFTLAAFLAMGQAGLIAGLVLWAVHLHWEPPPPLVALGAAATLAAAGLAWLIEGVPELPDAHLVAHRSVPSLIAVIGVAGLVVAAWRATTTDTASADLARVAAQGGQLLRALARPVVRADRLPEVALMRSLAIVTVVWIHALPPEFDTARLPIDRWLGDVTRFAVPVFVFAAGYLAARHPLPAGWTRRRLGRLVLPYLLASVVAFGLRTWSSTLEPVSDPVTDLLLGATLGPYYFVLALVMLTLATPALLRLRGSASLVALVVALAAQMVAEVVGGALFWRVRNPLLWLAFYVGGILAWRHRGRLRRVSAMWPVLLLAWSLVATTLVVVPEDSVARDVLVVVGAWLMLGTLWLAGHTLTRLPRAAWWVDGATYPIYLYHLPFVIVVVGAFGSSILSMTTVIGWALGLIGAMSVIVIVRHVLGRASVRWLGA